MIEKEYRIVMPVSVEEYRCAQVYMTARSSLTEAMNEDGAGVEVLINRPGRHPKLGPAQYTKKIFHIDKRFPSWLRMVAPKSGSHLVEESWNAFPHTLTEIRFPVLSSFRITVESFHLPDRGESNPHGIDTRKHCEVVMIDIAQSLGQVNKDQDSSGRHGEDCEEDLTSFRSRCGRGPLVPNWQTVVEPVMCAYKRVACEIQLWGMQSKIENFMHTYERSLFHKANRNTFCWIDEWHGLEMEELRAYEAAVIERINLITRIKQGGDQSFARVAKLPPVRAKQFKRRSISGRQGDEGNVVQELADAESHSSTAVINSNEQQVLRDMQARAEAASRRSLVRKSLARSNRVASDPTAEEMKSESMRAQPKANSPAALSRAYGGEGRKKLESDLYADEDVFSRERCRTEDENGDVLHVSEGVSDVNGRENREEDRMPEQAVVGQQAPCRELGAPTSSTADKEINTNQKVGMQISTDVSKGLQVSDSEIMAQQRAMVSPESSGCSLSKADTIMYTPKAAENSESILSLGPFACSPDQLLREPLGGGRDSHVEEKCLEEGVLQPSDAVAEKITGIKTARPSHGNPEDELCGCGILFEIDDCNQLRISYLVEGGPAHSSGVLREGDILTSIDMQDVTKKDICQIAPLLLGPEKSQIALGFQRFGAGADIVVLERRPYPATLLSDDSRPSTPGRPRILSLRGRARKAPCSDSSGSHRHTPVSYATSRSTPTLMRESCAESPSAGVGSGLSSTSQDQASAEMVNRLMIDEQAPKKGGCKMESSAKRNSGLGSRAIPSEAQSIVDSSSSSHLKDVVRWKKDQREPRRKEQACSISGCSKAGMYKFAVGDMEKRVCSIECKLALLHRNARCQHADALADVSTYSSPGSPHELPDGWEVRVDARGRKFYLDHNSCTSHWQCCV